MPERMTFPLGGRWHGEAVTDEGKRGDFLGDNDKRGKITDMVLLFPPTEPFGASAPHPPQCAHWGTFPRGGRSWGAALILTNSNLPGGFGFRNPNISKSSPEGIPNLISHI